jgi:Tol biopolymer transport system component
MNGKKLLKILIPVFLVSAFVLFVKIPLYHSPKEISLEASKEEYLKIANGYIQKNQPESAIYPLLLAIEKDQDDPEAHFLLAQTYYQSQIYDLARKECETALVLDAQNKKAFDLLTRIRFEQARIKWNGKYRSDFLSLREALSEFIYVLNNTQDQELIDSIADLTGGKYKIRRLTNDLFFDNAPSFSHDGKSIIFHSDTNYSAEDYGLKKREVKKSRIFVMDLNGENKMCLSSNEKDDSSEQFARFSFDDQKIVYEKENQHPEQKDTALNLDRDIFIKNLDTGEVKRLTHNDSYDGLASFSPDDKTILFVRGHLAGGSAIFTLNLNTEESKSFHFPQSKVEKIMRRPTGITLPYSPSFSPDGKKILFHAGWESRKIFLVDKNGENLTCLTKGQADNFFPAFAPDGKKVVFISNEYDQDDLFLVNSDGSNLARLTYDGGEKRYPSFSPDGSLIAFAGKPKGQDDRYFEIYVLNLKETISKEKLIERLQEMLKSFS